jgi:predicted nucleic acid-binding protein
VIACDTGPIVAALNVNDSRHRTCLDLLERHEGPLLVPAPVLTEVCYLLESRSGPKAEAAFLRALHRGELVLVDLVPADLARMADLVETYSDMPLGAVDAAVVAIAERLGLVEVATLDRRHFTVVRPKHVPAFTLLP